MIEVDFLAVEGSDGPGSKSGDAIAIRYEPGVGQRSKVVLIDGGYGEIGARLVRHVNERYGSAEVNLVVSTHPDANPLNGLIRVVQELEVKELMMHLPWEHHNDVDEYSNLEKIEELYSLAVTNDVKVTEPFAGEIRFEDSLRILGPSSTYYEELLAEAVPTNVVEKTIKASAQAIGDAFAKSELSDDELDNSDDTSPRNNTSVILSIIASNEFHVFTGDAGITALTHAADEFKSALSGSRPSQVEFFQVPHHGSRHNLGPEVLDLWFPRGSVGTTAFISSALADEKHPGTAVLAELRSRGFLVHSTEGKDLLHFHGSVNRPDYREAPPA